MPDFAVKQWGKDTSGRDIWMTVYMHHWYEARCAVVGFRPTIVQGAFMLRDGGGAATSAGYHDQGGCLDVRTWDLTASQLDAWVRECRRNGGAAWRRDKTPRHGGMDPHCHITLGTDKPLSAGARASWESYLAGHNGLANNAPDYEWRPSPLVTKPPPPQEDDMPYTDWPEKDRKALAADVAAAVLGADVTNRAPDGTVQGQRSVSQMITNLEKGMDANFVKLRDLIKKKG